MPALNYKLRFAEDVESGRKRQTIRSRRKTPIKKGDTLYHYTGMRTKECRKLLESVCASTAPIWITINDEVFVDCVRQDEDERLAVARADGFDDVRGFLAFFRQQYGMRRFDGDIIKW